ncbi:MAG: hypothetical protein FWG87_05655 [Defluviitaleaceae bacterium]|nr:hypothetical protein [Defluviitaleaceae bacterium]
MISTHHPQENYILFFCYMSMPARFLYTANARTTNTRTTTVRMANTQTTNARTANTQTTNARTANTQTANARTEKSSRFFVGDGFIRPEVSSLCFNARYPSRIDERAYLGTDKSVPYKKAIKHEFIRIMRIKKRAR